jgi:NAD(P)-dependent dehydrogenase (short-subunit alcohol dehydrogenase family)
LEQVLLVTGGSRGIGAATALLAASQGFAVAVNYMANAAAADEVVRRIRAGGGKSVALQADVSQEHQVLAMFEKVDAELGRLTALVNNAGVVDRAARVEEMSFERLRRMFDVNVIGSFLCAREAVRRMSTEGAIDAFTIGLAREVAAEGIRVNAVRPGLIDTEIHASGGSPDRVRQLAGQVPMQRGGTAQEVAEAIVWLLSSAASYTTLSLLDVSGGR